MRLIRAEVLKLVRRRGLMIWSALLAVGVLTLVETVLVVLHAVNAAHHGPAGGASNFRGATETLALLGTLTAVLIGSTAGSQDVGNGVFRDLVVTGRKRSTLFDVRVPGAFLVWLPLTLAGFAVATIASFAFKGYLPNPTWFEISHELMYVLALGTVNLVVAVGLTAFMSSRVAIGVLIVWNTAISHLLIAFHSLGGARKFLDVAAAEHFVPGGRGDQHISMSTATAVIVLVVWAAVFARAGRFWTNRIDA